LSPPPSPHHPPPLPPHPEHRWEQTQNELLDFIENPPFTLLPKFDHDDGHSCTHTHPHKVDHCPQKGDLDAHLKLQLQLQKPPQKPPHNACPPKPTCPPKPKPNPNPTCPPKPKPKPKCPETDVEESTSFWKWLWD
jgi:hypothetical protein